MRLFFVLIIVFTLQVKLQASPKIEDFAKKLNLSIEDAEFLAGEIALTTRKYQKLVYYVSDVKNDFNEKVGENGFIKKEIDRLFVSEKSNIQYGSYRNGAIVEKDALDYFNNLAYLASANGLYKEIEIIFEKEILLEAIEKISSDKFYLKLGVEKF